MLCRFGIASSSSPRTDRAEAFAILAPSTLFQRFPRLTVHVCFLNSSKANLLQFNGRLRPLSFFQADSCNIKQCISCCKIEHAMLGFPGCQILRHFCQLPASAGGRRTPRARECGLRVPGWPAYWPSVLAALVDILQSTVVNTNRRVLINSLAETGNSAPSS